jgi:hypothetical protein
MTSVVNANQKIKDKQVEFLKDNEWVLFTNCDEIVAADPRKYKDIREFMEKVKDDYVPCEAFDVLQDKGEPPLDYDMTLLAQRKFWIKNINYNKIILSRVPLDWNEGQHQIKYDGGEESKGFKDTGLYLIHLKFADKPSPDRDLGPFQSNGTLHFEENDKLEIPDYIKEIA